MSRNPSSSTRRSRAPQPLTLARRPAPAPRRQPGRRTNPPSSGITRTEAKFNIPVTTGVTAGVWDAGTLAIQFAPTQTAWWAALTRLYNKFRINWIRFDYSPAVSTYATGQLAFVIDSDPVVGTASFTDVSNSFRAKVCSIRDRASLSGTPEQLHRLPWYYVGDTATAPATGSVPFVFYAAYSAGSTGTGGSGDLLLGTFNVTLGLEVSEPSAIAPASADPIPPPQPEPFYSVSINTESPNTLGKYFTLRGNDRRYDVRCQSNSTMRFLRVYTTDDNNPDGTANYYAFRITCDLTNSDAKFSRDALNNGDPHIALRNTISGVYYPTNPSSNAAVTDVTLPVGVYEIVRA